MLVHIYDDLFIADIQERFSKCFPSLKIEFYSKAHHVNQSTGQKFLLETDKKVGEVRTNHASGNLDIKSWFTVERVEKDFKQKFGLNIQIFRKEGTGWVQTTNSDTYTLQQQSDMVGALNDSIPLKLKGQIDENRDL